MIVNEFSFFFLTVVGCAAAAYVICRHIRQLETQQLKESLRTWKGEGWTPGASRDSSRGASRGHPRSLAAISRAWCSLGTILNHHHTEE